MNNVVLIGMPGAGKSTAGVLLAKALGLDFIDTDIIIQNQIKTTLQTFIDENGIESFMNKEDAVVGHLQASGAVIATGGSVVYGKNAMENLKKDSVVVYLTVGLEQLEKRLSDITTRGIVIKKGQTIADLFKERDVLYRKYADIIVNEDNQTLEQTVQTVIEMIKSFH